MDSTLIGWNSGSCSSKLGMFSVKVKRGDGKKRAIVST